MFVKLIKYSICQKLVPQAPQNCTSSKCIYSTIAEELQGAVCVILLSSLVLLN